MPKTIRYTEREDEVEKSPLIQAMITAVHEGGETALQSFTKDDLTYTRKQDSTNSFQLQADLDTEATLKDSLTKNYTEKSFSFYSEEGEALPTTFETDIVFIADPIDGSTNFKNKNNYWGITLSAYATDKDGHIDEPLASIIYHPKVKELLWTSSEEGFINAGNTFRMRGHGTDTIEALAHRADRPKTKEENRGEILDHKNITMITSGNADDYFDALTRGLHDKGVSIRNLGSTAISLGEVAGHGSHGLICLGETNKWDVAAGIHLAESSECTIINRQIELPNGKETPLLIVAKNKEIANELEIAVINTIYYPETVIDPLRTPEHSQACAKARGAI